MDKREQIARMAQTKEDEMLLAKIYERMTNAAARNIPAATGFLSKREQMLAAELLRLHMAAKPTPEEAEVIQRLLELARQVDHALDDSEEVAVDGFRSHNIAGQDFDDVVEALDALEDLNAPTAFTRASTTGLRAPDRACSTRCSGSSCA